MLDVVGKASIVFPLCCDGLFLALSGEPESVHGAVLFTRAFLSGMNQYWDAEFRRVQEEEEVGDTAIPV